jgi:hypothetical protein
MPPAYLAYFSCTTPVTLHRLIHRRAGTHQAQRLHVVVTLAIRVEGATTQGSATRAACQWRRLEELSTVHAPRRQHLLLELQPRFSRYRTSARLAEGKAFAVTGVLKFPRALPITIRQIGSRKKSTRGLRTGSSTQMVLVRILYPDECPHSLTASKRSRVLATYPTLGGRIRSL